MLSSPALRPDVLSAVSSLVPTLNCCRRQKMTRSMGGTPSLRRRSKRPSLMVIMGGPSGFGWASSSARPRGRNSGGMETEVAEGVEGGMGVGEGKGLLK